MRPQSIALGTQPSGDGLAVPGTVVERAYLGEHWDYVIQPGESGLRLRVSAPPQQVLDVGAPVWLGFDPAQMAAID